MRGYFIKCIKSKPILLLVLSGILIRIIIFYLYRHVTLFPDSEGYIALGNQLATFDLSGYNGQRSPGYPFLLFLTGTNLSITLLVQFVMGICTTVLIYKSMLLLRFSTVIAFFTALFLNNWLHVIFYETAILTESLTLFMISLIITLYLKYFSYANSFKKMFLLSLALGFLVLIKPFYFFLPFIFYAFPLLKKFSISTILNKRIVIFIFPVISFFGWSFVNKINTGYFVSTTFYGYNIAQNCVTFAEKTPDTFHTIRDIYVKNREMAKNNNKDVAMSIWFAYDELRTATGLSFTDLSFQLSEFSKTAIRNNPVDYVYQAICVSWIDFWKTGIYWNYPDFKIPLFNKLFIGLWCLQSAILQYLKLVFVLLFPIQLYDFFTRKIITHELFFSVIIHTTALLQALVTYGNNSRFSYPFEFLMVITVMLFFKRKGWLKY